MWVGRWDCSQRQRRQRSSVPLRGSPLCHLNHFQRGRFVLRVAPCASSACLGLLVLLKQWLLVRQIRVWGCLIPLLRSQARAIVLSEGPPPIGVPVDRVDPKLLHANGTRDPFVPDPLLPRAPVHLSGHGTAGLLAAADQGYVAIRAVVDVDQSPQPVLGVVQPPPAIRHPNGHPVVLCSIAPLVRALDVLLSRTDHLDESRDVESPVLGRAFEEWSCEGLGKVPAGRVDGASGDPPGLRREHLNFEGRLSGGTYDGQGTEEGHVVGCLGAIDRKDEHVGLDTGTIRSTPGYHRGDVGALRPRLEVVAQPEVL
eukprot:Sspe_Gene.11162::Locus_3762_Transcript_1_1_Confidence_1.000_Length_1191::g.11162::m.11162